MRQNPISSFKIGGSFEKKRFSYCAVNLHITLDKENLPLFWKKLNKNPIGTSSNIKFQNWGFFGGKNQNPGR